MKRIFNDNRFVPNDSNPWYLIVDAIYNEMIALDRAGRGTLFSAVR